MMAPCVVAQRRDRHDRRKAAAVLADVGQLVDVLDAARGLEDQRLEARRDRRAELDAQRLGARDHFLRIGDVGRGDLVDDVGGGVAQHALGADVEELNDALLVGGDAREVGAVEDGVLQRPRLEQRLLAPNLGDDVRRPGVAILTCRILHRGQRHSEPPGGRHPNEQDARHVAHAISTLFLVNTYSGHSQTAWQASKQTMDATPTSTSTATPTSTATLLR